MITGLIRRSLEDPSVPLSDIDSDHYLFPGLTGGTSSDAGVRVSYKQALSYPAFWRGINLISRDVAKIPLLVYKRTTGQDRDRAPEHPAYPLIRRRPSKLMKAFDFKQTITSHGMMHGNGYAYIYRGGDGRPLEMLPLSPLSTYWLIVDGELWYITTVDGEQRKLDSADVVHIKGLGSDGLGGYDVVSIAKHTLGLGLAIRKFGSLFFKSGATLGVVLEHPGVLGDDAMKNLRKSWEAMHKGLDASHKLAILEEGMKANVIAQDARKSQLIQSRQFELREVANILGVPPHKVGDTTRTAYASLEQENQAYLDESLDPWLCQWEEECTAKLISEKELASESHWCEFLRAAIVRVDIASRFEAYAKAINNGWMSPNEARRRENMNAVPGLDQFFMPAGVVPLGNSPQSLPGRADAQRLRAILCFRRLLVDTARRMVRRIVVQARAAAKSPDSYIAWVEAMPDQNREVIGQALGSVIDAGRAALDLPGSEPIAADESCGRFWTAARESLLSAAEVKPAELSDSVSRVGEVLALRLPDDIADSFLEN